LWASPPKHAKSRRNNTRSDDTCGRGFSSTIVSGVDDDTAAYVVVADVEEDASFFFS
jgi:hypothetical protein